MRERESVHVFDRGARVIRKMRARSFYLISLCVDRALTSKKKLQRSCPANGPHLSQEALVHNVGTVSHEIHMGTFRYVCSFVCMRAKKGKEKKGRCDRSQQDSNLRGQSPMDF